MARRPAAIEKAELDIGYAGCNERYIMTRAQLQKECLSYFLRHGVANLSLRPLAAAAGTSARMLLHYFGSKEALIAEVMQHVHARLQGSFAELAASLRAKNRENLLRDFWNVLSAKANRPAFRLLFEVQLLALQNPKRYRRYLSRTSKAWRELIERALPSKQKNAVTATLYSAVIDGLLLELLSTGDLERTSRALSLFARQCQPAGGRNRARR
jgi:AcrR family transcriptional regulator